MSQALQPRRPFAASTKRVLSVARRTAEQALHPFVGTGHFLVAVARADRSSFPDPGAAEWIDAVTREVIYDSGALREAWGSSRPYTANARLALEKADELAPPNGSIRPEHLLEAIRDIEGSTGALVYQRYAGRQVAGAPQPKPATDWSFLDRIEAPDQATILTALRRAIARGELAPGERLPAVRRLAQRLDVAPGTVASAYKRLGEVGLLEARGRLGTRVALDPPARGARKERVEKMRQDLLPVLVTAVHTGTSYKEVEEALRLAAQDLGELED